MASTTSRSIDFAQLQQKITDQFNNLDPKDPSSWPAIPRYGLLLLTSIVVVAALWFAWLVNYDAELQLEQAKEIELKKDFQTKVAKANNLDVLKKQREQVKQYVYQLEKQLPGKAEMDALLSDINQAGLGRSLQFDIFRPGQIAVKDYYAELPIVIKVSGRYHDIGAFASDIANLSRIVTLNNLSIVPKPDGSLILDTTAKTFRYLDPEEVAAQQKAAGAKATGDKGGKK